MRRMQDREEWEMGYKGGDKGREEDFPISRVKNTLW